MDTQKQKHIVVVGGGFGGVQAALTLSHKLKSLKLTDRYKLFLIDQNSFHTFTPTLYEAATTTDMVASNSQIKRIVTFSLKEIFEGFAVEILQSKVTKIDTAEGDIHFESGTAIKYDWLLMAAGSQVNYFNIPGLAQHSLSLKSFADALRIRERIIEHVENEERPRIQVLIGGGGPTGVELAGEIKNLLHELPRITVGKCLDGVTIIDGGATILSVFNQGIISRAQKRLAALEIQTMSGERIQSVDEKEVSLASGKKVPYDVLIWTGGVMPNQLMSTMKMKKDASGAKVLASQEMVCLPESEDLHITGKIYGIGDAVCVIDPATGRPVPGVARAAIVQGRVAATNIIEEIKLQEKLTDKPAMLRYHPAKYPYILPVGGKFAIAQFGPIIFSGFFAWIVKGLVEFNYFRSIFPMRRALSYWLKGLWIFLRNDRLG